MKTRKPASADDFIAGAATQKENQKGKPGPGKPPGEEPSKNKQFFLPVVMIEEFKEMAREQFVGNDSAALRYILKEALEGWREFGDLKGLKFQAVALKK